MAPFDQVPMHPSQTASPGSISPSSHSSSSQALSTQAPSSQAPSTQAPSSQAQPTQAPYSIGHFPDFDFTKSPSTPRVARQSNHYWLVDVIGNN